LTGIDGPDERSACVDQLCQPRTAGQEDGYYGRRTYGTSANGSSSLLGTVLNMILNLQPLQ